MKKRLKGVDPPDSTLVSAAAASEPTPGAADRVVRPPATHHQPVELGTIHYCNLTPDGKHGDYDAALQAAAASGKPIFANFVEWSG